MRQLGSLPVRRAWPLAAFGVLSAACVFDSSGLRERKDNSPATDRSVDQPSIAEGTGGEPVARDLRPEARADRATSTWWNNDWPSRRKLTFDNSAAGSVDLVDFPVLVVLNDQRITYSGMAAGGADLRFVDVDQQTLLAHEIEAWNNKGTSYVWVRVPLIHKSSKTDTIWMYYGSSSAPDAQQRNAVWSKGFAGVWHLSTLEDSTANGNNAKATGTKSAPGKIASGRTFDASKSEYLELPDQPALRLSQLSVELYLKTNQAWDQEYYPGSATLVGRSSAGCNSHDWAMIGGRDSSGDDGCVIAGDGAASTGCDVTVSSDKGHADDKQHYVVWTRASSGDSVIYVDGAQEGTQKDDGSAIDAARPIQIGGDTHGGGRYFNGTLDEVRISSEVRSAGWIKAQHRSMLDASNNPFVTYGPEESRPQ